MPGADQGARLITTALQTAQANALRRTDRLVLPAAPPPASPRTSPPVFPGRGQAPLNLPAGDLLHGLAHHLLEDREQRLRCQRAQPLESIAHLWPVLLGPAGRVEWLPHVLQEEVDEHPGHAPRARPHL